MAVAVILLAAMVLPDPAAKLCIAPGNHVAIERIDSDCCGSHDLCFAAEKDCRDCLEAGGDCGRCTDLPILSFGPETVRTLRGATGIPAFENPGIRAALNLSAPLSARDRTVDRAMCQVSPSMPLLC